jgi:Calcineurin-like phosphoesterase
MSKTYAIADLHGRFDLLEMALASIVERTEPSATLVTLGDYVDRGPDSRKVIERLMAGPGYDDWRLICLKGNHEDIVWQTCRRLPDADWWLTNGGGATLISYGQQKGEQADVTIVPASHLDWIERLPLIYVDEHRFSYTRASIQTVRWMSRTPKASCGKSIGTMTMAGTASATSYTGIMHMRMGRSSRRTGQTLIRLRGTLGGSQSASLTMLCPVDRSKFSKSTASRLRRYYRADGRWR